MTSIKRNPYLALFLFLCTSSTYGYKAKIINLDKTPPHLRDFEFTAPEDGVTLSYKGDNKENEFIFEINFPSYDSLNLYVPKVITKENPVYTCNPKTGVTHPHGLVKTHNGKHRAHDVEQIKDFQDSLDPKKILELPESTITNNTPKTYTYDGDHYDGDDDYTSVNEPTSFAPNNSSWISYIVGGSAASFLLLGYYYLTTNAALCARYLSRRDLWSSWKHQESYETLLLIDPKYLAKDLIQDIKTTYYQKDNPIELFLRDIEEEYETLLQWMQFRNIAYRFRLALDSDFDHIESRLKLLNRMRRAVHHWRAREMEKK